MKIHANPFIRLLFVFLLCLNFSHTGEAAIKTMEHTAKVEFRKADTSLKKGKKKRGFWNRVKKLFTKKKKTKNKKGESALSKEKWGWASIGLLLLSIALTSVSVLFLLGVFCSSILCGVSYFKDEKRGAFTLSLILHAAFLFFIFYVMVKGISLISGPILTF